MGVCCVPYVVLMCSLVDEKVVLIRSASMMISSSTFVLIHVHATCMEVKYPFLDCNIGLR